MLPIGQNTLLATLSPAMARPAPADANCRSCGARDCDCQGAQAAPLAPAQAQVQAREEEKLTISDEARLRSEEAAELHRMKARDREVRSHEQAHLAAAGSLARGGASFGYETGPDGRPYAVSGEVTIDTAPVPGDPAATLRKAAQIRKAALAPARPSAQDRAVAAEAAAMAAQARQDLAAERREEGAGAVGAYAAFAEPQSDSASLLPTTYA